MLWMRVSIGVGLISARQSRKGREIFDWSPVGRRAWIGGDRSKEKKGIRGSGGS